MRSGIGACLLVYLPSRESCFAWAKRDFLHASRYRLNQRFLDRDESTSHALANERDGAAERAFLVPFLLVLFVSNHHVEFLSSIKAIKAILEDLGIVLSESKDISAVVD